MRDQKKKEIALEGVFFFRLNALREIHQDVAVCKKKVPFECYQGRLWVIFQTSPFYKTCSQKITFRGKILRKTMKNSSLGVFFLERVYLY